MDNQSARWLLSAMHLIAAYEFLISGLDKIVSGRFPAGLDMALMDGASANPNQWYIRWVLETIMPHSVAFGYLIEWGELAVGIGLALAAARWLAWPSVAPARRQRLTSALTLLAVIASLVGAFMTFNFHLYMGRSPIALVNPANPFDEGVDLDLTLTLALLALAAVNAVALRQISRIVSEQTARAKQRLHAKLPSLHALLAK